MPSHPPIPRGRTLILLLVVALCAGLGAVGTLLYPFGGSQPSAAAAVRPDSDAVIYSRLEPSVVDVTATLAPRWRDRLGNRLRR